MVGGPSSKIFWKRRWVLRVVGRQRGGGCELRGRVKEWGVVGSGGSVSLVLGRFEQAETRHMGLEPSAEATEREPMCMLYAPAVTAVERDGIPVLVSHDLDLQVAGLRAELHHEHGRAGHLVRDLQERVLRWQSQRLDLGLKQVERHSKRQVWRLRYLIDASPTRTLTRSVLYLHEVGAELLGVLGKADALATATLRGLEHHGVPDPSRRVQSLVHGADLVAGEGERCAHHKTAGITSGDEDGRGQWGMRVTTTEPPTSHHGLLEDLIRDGALLGQLGRQPVTRPGDRRHLR